VRWSGTSQLKLQTPHKHSLGLAGSPANRHTRTQGVLEGKVVQSEKCEIATSGLASQYCVAVFSMVRPVESLMTFNHHSITDAIMEVPTKDSSVGKKLRLAIHRSQV